MGTEDIEPKKGMEEVPALLGVNKGQETPGLVKANISEPLHVCFVLTFVFERLFFREP